jgi:hypothetical protein
MQVGLFINLFAMVALHQLEPRPGSGDEIIPLTATTTTIITTTTSISSSGSSDGSLGSYMRIKTGDQDDIENQDQDQDQGQDCNNNSSTTITSNSNNNIQGLFSESSTSNYTNNWLGYINETMQTIRDTEVPRAPAMVAFSDVITGFASGMTIKFFPIFFIHVFDMSPVMVSAIYIACPLFSSVMLQFSQRYLGRRMGRIWSTVFQRIIGVSLLLVICYIASLPNPKQYMCLISVLFIIRTGWMNSNKPNTKSIINDMVPNEQRGRWNSLEALNAASWSGSAMIGGWTVDTYGFVPVFTMTAILQGLSCVPLCSIAHLIPEEGGGKQDKNGGTGTGIQAKYSAKMKLPSDIRRQGGVKDEIELTKA